MCWKRENDVSNQTSVKTKAHGTTDMVIFNPKERLGILDFRLVGYYKIKQGVLEQNISRYSYIYK